MTSSSENLSEIEQLRAQLAEKEAQLQNQSERLKSQSERLKSQSDRIAILEEIVRHLKIKRFTPSSEKTHPGQFRLFDEAELCTDPVLDAHEKQDEEQKKKNTSKPRGRKPLSNDLPREQIFLYLTDAEKTGAKSTFFAKVKEELVPFPFNSDRLSYQSNGSSFTSITTLILLLTPASFVINPRSSSFNNI
ncbi:transposase [Vibrio metschnikovii]|uniref:transposase n=1 Tax=Vibrio metschnikovii TaxID=28172 RepID=UPI00331DA210